MFLTFEGAFTTLQYSSAMESISLQIQEQISVTTGERLKVALVNRHELIRFEEVFFKQKILFPENFGEGLGRHL